MSDKFLPYARPNIEQADIDAVVEVLRSGWLSTGPAVQRFERAFAEHTGAREAVSCSSGTAALHLALAALGIGPGDAVVVPSLTFAATANAARLLGAEVMFADVDPATGNMTPAHAEEACARAELPVKAILPVHFAGQAVDLPGVAAVADRQGAVLVEDACHAFGARYRHDGETGPIGSGAFGLCAAFSFHPVKPIATGEGGMVTTPDACVARRLRQLRSHGLVHDRDNLTNREMGLDAAGEKNPWYHELTTLGWNYRLSDIHSALGYAQLSRADSMLAERRRMAGVYDELVADLAPYVTPLGGPQRNGSAHHLYVARIDFAALKTTRAAVMNGLRERNIGTQVHYIPLHLQPYYVERYGKQRLPGVEAYYATALSLPLFAGMEEDDARRTVAALRDVLAGRS